MLSIELVERASEFDYPLSSSLSSSSEAKTNQVAFPNHRHGEGGAIPKRRNGDGGIDIIKIIPKRRHGNGAAIPKRRHGEGGRDCTKLPATGQMI